MASECPSFPTFLVCKTLNGTRNGTEQAGFRALMSALPPKADIIEGCNKCLLLTQSGHSLDRVIQPVGTENQEMLYAFLGTS